MQKMKLTNNFANEQTYRQCISKTSQLFVGSQVYVIVCGARRSRGYCFLHPHNQWGPYVNIKHKLIELIWSLNIHYTSDLSLMHVNKNNPRKIISPSTKNTVKKDFNHKNLNSCFITWIFFSKIVCLLKGLQFLI
jgi:hypothetical protein